MGCVCVGRVVVVEGEAGSAKSIDSAARRRLPRAVWARDLITGRTAAAHNLTLTAVALAGRKARASSSSSSSATTVAPVANEYANLQPAPASQSNQCSVICNAPEDTHRLLHRQ